MTGLGINSSDPSINNNGQVVVGGYLWQNDTRIDLNSLLDPALGWTNLQAADINDAGQVVGRGTHQGVDSGFLLSFGTGVLPPSISISDVSVTEGDTGAVYADFIVTRSGPTDQITTINYTTADSTAKAGKDYVVTSGTLTFNPGETSKTVSVAVSGDWVDEYDETFFVNLQNAKGGAKIRGGQAVDRVYRLRGGNFLGWDDGDNSRPALLPLAGKTEWARQLHSDEVRTCKIMLTVKNILVGTDFSDISQAAMDYARALAHAFGARCAAAVGCASSIGTRDWVELHGVVFLTGRGPDFRPEGLSHSRMASAARRPRAPSSTRSSTSSKPVAPP
jgi:hypothetical protein